MSLSLTKMAFSSLSVRALSSGQKWFLRPYFPLIRGMFLLRSGPRFSFCAWTESEEKATFNLLIWPFPHSRFGHFQCPKRKSKTTSQLKHTPNQWEIWPQKPILTTGKCTSFLTLDQTWRPSWRTATEQKEGLREAFLREALVARLQSFGNFFAWSQVPGWMVSKIFMLLSKPVLRSTTFACQ